MGNSPSQQVAEGPQGDPDDFDLNAIRDSSDEEEGESVKERKSALEADQNFHSKGPSNHPTALKEYPGDVKSPKPGCLLPSSDQTSQPNDPAQAGNSLPTPPASTREPIAFPAITRNRHHKSERSYRLKEVPVVKQELFSDPIPHGSFPPEREENSTAKVHQVLENSDSLSGPNQDTKMQDPDETSSEGSSSDDSSPAGSPLDRQPFSSKTSIATKRKRAPSISEETRIAYPRKRTRQQSSENGPRKGLKALEYDAARSESDMDEPHCRKEMATSVAKRTYPFLVKKVGENSPNVRDIDDSEDSASEYVVEEEEDDKDEDDDNVPAEEASKKGKKPNNLFFCTFEGCRKQFESKIDWLRHEGKHKIQPKPNALPKKVQTSALKRASRTPRSSRVNPTNPDDFDFEASDDTSNQESPRKQLLSRHQKSKLPEEYEQETGNKKAAASTGRFSDAEVRKLETYKREFCSAHDIDGHYFNDMMTESCRRRERTWSYTFITKSDFLTQYFEVLPHRKRKSMARYRERNWQNATGIKNWSQEDDDQIIKLVEQLGPKWVEIGQRLTRTQDAVQQRWKKVLQFTALGVTIRKGEWSAEENETLVQAVNRTKKNQGLAQDESTDRRVVWSFISTALGNTRTPKQCADRWKDVRKHGDTWSGKRLSEAYVNESEEGFDDAESEGNSRHEIESMGLSVEQNSTPVTAKVPEMASNEWDMEGESTAPAQERGENDFVSATQSARESRDISITNGGSQIAFPLQLSAASNETPSKFTTLSQAFANTQANSSALRRPVKSSSPGPRNDRPSPGIPMKLRTQSPVIRAKKLAEADLEEAETLIVGAKQRQTLRSSTSSYQRDGTRQVVQVPPESESDGTESSSDEDEDEEVFGVSKKRPLLSQPISTTNDAASSHSDNENDEPEAFHDAQDLQDRALVMPQGFSPFEARRREEEKQEEESTSESGSDSEGSSSSDGESGPASDEDEDEDESEDSIIKDTRNDFMESIKQTARKAELAKLQSSIRQASALDDSDSDSESAGEEIEHG